MSVLEQLGEMLAQAVLGHLHALGGEVIRQLKSRDADARIIAISGRNLFHDNDDYIDQVKRQGAAAILRKLDSREMVLAEIGRVLKKPSS